MRDYHDYSLKDMVKLHEGLGLKPYRCPAGKLTIGYGRNLDDVGISEAEADVLLENDLQGAAHQLIPIFGEVAFRNFSTARQNALIDMMFNLGRSRFFGFRRMIEAIHAGDWEKAAVEAQDSMWFEQVGRRGTWVVSMLREG